MKYIAKTHVALNVQMNGSNVHVSFTPQTGGGSVFYTDDNALAEALEKHVRFGRLFEKAAEPVEVEVVKKKVESVPAVPVKKEKEKTFACYEDAKDYLVDTFGISRTKLRSKTAIEAAAKANNIILKIEE